MLDDDGNAIIIDFDSCMPIGQDIGCRKAGTFGWEMDPVPSTSAPDNDMYGLKLIAKFMEERKSLPECDHLFALPSAIYF